MKPSNSLILVCAISLLSGMSAFAELLSNSAFESGIKGWAGRSATIAEETNPVHLGSGAVRYPISIVDPVGNKVGQTTLRARYDPVKPANGLEIVSMDAHPYYFDFEQFYDLSVDPTEINNLAELPEHAEKIAAMQTELEKFVNPLPGGFAEFKTTNNELHLGMMLELF
jgi:hypothetical protein